MRIYCPKSVARKLSKGSGVFHCLVKTERDTNTHTQNRCPQVGSVRPNLVFRDERDFSVKPASKTRCFEPILQTDFIGFYAATCVPFGPPFEALPKSNDVFGIGSETAHVFEIPVLVETLWKNRSLYQTNLQLFSQFFRVFDD